MDHNENFAVTIAADGARAQRGEDGRVDAIVLTEGRAIAWRAPIGAEPGTREYDLAARLVRSATKAAGEIDRIRADPDRSDAWKDAEAERVAARVGAEFASARSEADRHVAEFEARDAQEAVAPPLAAGDHAAALVDHECRMWLRGLDRDALVKLATELTDPRHARLLAAMMRSPVPLPGMLGPVASAAWLDVQAKADPQGARLRRQATERVGWLRQVIEQSANALPKPRPSRAPIVQRVA
ncbi:hypothetical protein [Dokdonella sp.]|uniref:hypothetical protein n=1 Tax=Dokdonella sp. TaxID=2291710 RepID=UPI0037851FE9